MGLATLFKVQNQAFYQKNREHILEGFISNYQKTRDNHGRDEEDVDRP